MEDTTVKVALRVKPIEEYGPGNAGVMTVVKREKGASLLLKNPQRHDSGELFQYNFWHVLEGASQREMFESCARPMVDSALKGYNATILAYGQTGAGKTYTMLGPHTDALVADSGLQGIIPRAIDQVFSELADGMPRMWTVKATYIEIYNENIRDLLNPHHRDISVLESNLKTGGFVTLKNVDFVEVQTKERALEILRKGQLNRHIAANGVNDHSSRSHTIFTLWIETVGIDGKTIRSKLNLVDLAGSERLQRINSPTGKLVREATLINKSLSVLSMVAKELMRKSVHIPYRDSKLTHFLKDSIGGNCKTLVMACIWPDEEHLRETISTCRFADDLQRVEVHAKKNAGAGLEVVHGPLLRLDPATMKYIEMMTERRVSEKIANIQEQLRKQMQQMGSKSDSIPEFENLGSQGASMVDTYHELETLRSRVLEYERQQKEWETRRSIDTKEEVELLRQKVKEMEERERKMLAGDIRNIDSPGRVECGVEHELQQLRQRVMELEKAQTLNEQEVISLRRQAKVLNAHIALKNVPSDLRLGKMKTADMQDRLRNGPVVFHNNLMQDGRLRHRDGSWLSQKESFGDSNPETHLPPEVINLPEKCAKPDPMSPPSWGPDRNRHMPEGLVETEGPFALEKHSRLFGAVSQNAELKKAAAVPKNSKASSMMDRPKKKSWRHRIAHKVAKLLPVKCPAPKPDILRQPKVADWEDGSPQDFVIMSSLSHKQVTDLLNLTDALPVTVTGGIPMASYGNEFERVSEMEVESVLSDFPSSPLSLSSVPIAMDESPFGRVVQLSRRPSGIPPLDLSFANPYRI